MSPSISCVVVKNDLNNFCFFPSAPLVQAAIISRQTMVVSPLRLPASTLPLTSWSLTKVLQWLLLGPVVNSTLLGLSKSRLTQHTSPASPHHPIPWLTRVSSHGSLCCSNLPRSVPPQRPCTLGLTHLSSSSATAGLLSVVRSYFKCHSFREDFPD